MHYYNTHTHTKAQCMYLPERTTGVLISYVSLTALPFLSIMLIEAPEPEPELDAITPVSSINAINGPTLTTHTL